MQISSVFGLDSMASLGNAGGTQTELVDTMGDDTIMTYEQPTPIHLLGSMHHQGLQFGWLSHWLVPQHALCWLLGLVRTPVHLAL